MLILSQDKKAIHKFDNITSIQIEQANAQYKLYVYDTINDNTSLAGYDTEERAKEVLQEIITRYKNWENLKAGQPTGLCLPVYEMPEK